MDDKPTLGLVGLGNLGRAIALRLLGAGYRLLVNDRRWEVAQALELHGATAIPTPLLLAEEVDMFLTCLPGTRNCSRSISGRREHSSTCGQERR